jgi:hypothetical protein
MKNWRQDDTMYRNCTWQQWQITNRLDSTPIVNSPTITASALRLDGTRRSRKDQKLATFEPSKAATMLAAAPSWPPLKLSVAASPVKLKEAKTPFGPLILHCILPDNRSADVLTKLRNCGELPTYLYRTDKFRKSFLPNALANYQQLYKFF